MTPALLAVYDDLKTIVSNAVIYYEPNMMLSEQTLFHIIDIEYVDDLVNPPYTKVIFKAMDIESIIEEYDITLTSKYVATACDIYKNLDIVQHETLTKITPLGTFKYELIHVNGLTPATVDLIKAELPTDFDIDNDDPYEYAFSETESILSLKLISSVYLETYPYEVNNFAPRKNHMFAGEHVSIKITTINDKTRQILSNMETLVLQRIMWLHRKFDIIKATNVVGYYKLVELPNLTNFISNKDTEQSITINLKGYYLIDYSRC